MADDRKSVKLGALAGTGIAALVMGPSVYRLWAEPFQWGDTALVAVGVGLVIVHILRLVRLTRDPPASDHGLAFPPSCPVPAQLPPRYIPESPRN